MQNTGIMKFYKEISKKKLSQKEVFQRKLKVILKLRSAKIKIYNNSNSKRPDITIKEQMKLKPTEIKSTIIENKHTIHTL